ncbi:MAG: pilus assembly protein [Deltaproteobacteria bacterium]|nr:pilus assembly protein [Deltaproteobacteria bacterium]
MKISKLLKNQDGASAVEFAIVLPLFLVLTFGIIEFGVIMYNKAIITNASREGARFAILFDSVVHDDVDIANKVKAHLKFDPIDNSSILINLGGASAPPTILVSPTPVSNRPRRTPISVTVKYPYDFMVVPNFLPGLPQTLTLSAITSMRME